MRLSWIHGLWRLLGCISHIDGLATWPRSYFSLHHPGTNLSHSVTLLHVNSTLFLNRAQILKIANLLYFDYIPCWALIFSIVFRASRCAFTCPRSLYISTLTGTQGRGRLRTYRALS